MRVEVLSRVWVCDRKHNKCRVPFAVNVERERERALRSIDTERRLEEYVKFMWSTARFIRHHTYVKLKAIVFVDVNIHEEMDGYALMVAFMVRYGNVRWRVAYKRVLQKTLPFEFTDFQKRALSTFERMYGGVSS